MGSNLFAAIAAATSKVRWVPDIVGNLRVDQAWGSAQIMGALHDVGARYNTNNAGAAAVLRRTTTPSTAVILDDEVGLGGWCRHDPEDAVGCQGHPVRSDRVMPKVRARYVAFTYGNRSLHKQDIAVGSFNDAVFGGVGRVGWLSASPASN